MRQIKMLVDTEGAPDGVNVAKFKKGVQYNLPDDLAERFIRQGEAQAVSETPESAGPPETPEGGEGVWKVRKGQIREAINRLPEEGFTGDGKPSVNYLKDLLDDAVSAEERDAVWSEMKAERED